MARKFGMPTDIVSVAYRSFSMFALKEVCLNNSVYSFIFIPSLLVLKTKESKIVLCYTDTSSDLKYKTFWQSQFGLPKYLIFTNGGSNLHYDALHDT